MSQSAKKSNVRKFTNDEFVPQREVAKVESLVGGLATLSAPALRFVARRVISLAGLNMEQTGVPSSPAPVTKVATPSLATSQNPTGPSEKKLRIWERPVVRETECGIWLCGHPLKADHQTPEGLRNLSLVSSVAAVVSRGQKIGVPDADILDAIGYADGNKTILKDLFKPPVSSVPTSNASSNENAVQVNTDIVDTSTSSSVPQTTSAKKPVKRKESELGGLLNELGKSIQLEKAVRTRSSSSISDTRNVEPVIVETIVPMITDSTNPESSV